MNFKLDLHSHSIVSRDGSISLKQYQKVLRQKIVDYIAITDHNRIEFALAAKEKLGDAIIVGSEITTLNGDIVGLFLNDSIPINLTLEQAMDYIHAQGGLVCIPHPGEHWRRGIDLEVLDKLIFKVDIIEVFNSRTRDYSKAELIKQFAERNNIAMVSVSDSHDASNIGKAYTVISDKPTAENLVRLLKDAPHYQHKASFFSTVIPLFNKLKHRFIHVRS